MTKFGYALSAFRVHPHGGDSAPLGEFDGSADALPLLYGILRGLMAAGVSERQRHLQVTRVEAAGRLIRFEVDLGSSGQSSEFRDLRDKSKVVFTRNDQHVENTRLRGVLVAPSNSHVGLLALEVQGRVGAKALLAPVLKRLFKHFSGGFILDVAAVIDEEGLAKLLAEAQAHQITLRRSGLPSDVADAVELSRADAETGKLELKITPGRVKQFARDLVAKLRGEDNATRQRLLHVGGGLEFDEISVAMTVGERKTTLTVTAERVPSFIYDLANKRPDDDTFYREVTKTLREIAAPIGITVVGGWETGAWSEEALKRTLTPPPEE